MQLLKDYVTIIESGQTRTKSTCVLFTKDDGSMDEYFEANTEPEAIFTVCQWILDNRNKKQN